MGDSQSKLLDKPWRVVTWGAEDKLKHIRNYSPKGASQLRVLLYGPVGAGKSSFINSVAGVIRGSSVNYAAVNASNKSTKSFTVQNRTHRIKMEGSEEHLPIVFNDLMGLEGDNRGVQPDDVKLALEGRVRDGYEFRPECKLSPQDDHYNPEPNIDDKVHVLVCVLDASKTEISSSVLQKMNEVREAARDLGIPQVAVVTHIDGNCDEIKEDVRKVFKSKSLKETMEEFSADVGIPLNYMFPVWNNYEGVQKDSVDTLLLIALKNTLSYGGDFLDSQNSKPTS